MAIDIMSALVNFLCPTPQSAMACNQFINAPGHQVLAPIGPLLYFFFFPTVFMIILIYILSTSILKGPAGTIKGIRLLIALAVYIFIIINGWYSIMLPLAELWFILLPFLAILYFIVRHFSGGGGGRPGGGMPGFSGGEAGIFRTVKERFMSEVTGRRRRFEKLLDLKLKELESIKNTIKEDPGAWRAYAAISSEAYNVLAEYEKMVNIGGMPVGGRIRQKVQKLEKILKELSEKQSKAAKTQEKYYKEAA